MINVLYMHSWMHTLPPPNAPVGVGVGNIGGVFIK